MNASTIPYDDVLQADLDDKGPEILREQGSLTVDTRNREDRYNSALWFAMKWGLSYDYDADTGAFTIYAL